MGSKPGDRIVLARFVVDGEVGPVLTCATRELPRPGDHVEVAGASHTVVLTRYIPRPRCEGSPWESSAPEVEIKVTRDKATVTRLLRRALRARAHA